MAASAASAISTKPNPRDWPENLSVTTTALSTFPACANKSARSSCVTAAQPDETELLWERLAPHLDDAVAALSEADRSGDPPEVLSKEVALRGGATSGLSEKAAKKRVSRTVEKLRAYLTRRGVTLGGAVLAGLFVEKKGAGCAGGFDCKRA